MPVSFAEINRQKSQSLLEVTRLSRSLPPGQQAHLQSRLGPLRDLLARNHRLLGFHLAAVREVSDLMVGVLNNAESDGTYGQHPMRRGARGMSSAIRTIGLGIWAVIVALGATYMAATWNSGATVELVRNEQKPSGLEFRRPAAITVPMIDDGELRGYVVAKVVFTADAGELHAFPNGSAALRSR